MLPLGTLRAVEMLHDSVLYKWITDTDIHWVSAKVFGMQKVHSASLQKKSH